MSIECGECEHDLRGGHDEHCSRAMCTCGHKRSEHVSFVETVGECMHVCPCLSFTLAEPEELD